MSNRLTGGSADEASPNAAAGLLNVLFFRAHAGVGMLEFLVALMIFSMGMMGLLSAQLVGKKANFEASQRSVATALTRDVLERMRANPGQIAAYQVTGAGDAGNRLPRPDTDCDITVCTAQELAAFDLWQWESLLVGESEQDSVGSVGGLLTPRACIASDGGEVDVTISWRGVMMVGSAVTTDCKGDVDIESGPEDTLGDASQRHQVTVSTFIAAQ
jgi:type IV pilus assembly protein PilV|tara:strand:+ start:18718 stop:19365 length:648 start_codon:yes stop_codon:yes gene_type:complete